MPEKNENYLCIRCINETKPSQECNKCKESFIVSEITYNYICEPCRINDDWSDDWSDDFSNEVKTPYETSEIPIPPPPPKPYVPKQVSNVNISRKLFDETNKQTNVDEIDWTKVTEGWNNLYEDCKLDFQINEFTKSMQDPPDFIFPESRVQEQAEFADPWVFGPLNYQNDWDIEKGYFDLTKNETSSEEYIFPKRHMNNEYEDNPLINKIVEELLSDTDCSDDFDRNPEGTLELILGPMYSGKSTAALLKLAQMADIGFDVLYINHSDDMRITEAQDEVVSTHNSQYTSLSKKIHSLKISELKNANVIRYQYIGVDEGQFFPDLYENVIKWVSIYGKNVIVASLDGDAYRRKFGQVLDLVPNADSVTKLKAYCDTCRENEKKIKPAPFTARLVGGTDAKVVGGRNLYMAMCRECHNKHLTETGL